VNLPSLSQRAFFGFSFDCHYREEALPVNADLREWGPEYLIPELSGVDGGPAAFGELYMAWNDDGLYFALEVAAGKTGYKVDPKKYWQGDCLEMWIDTRDVKDAHRANRFCHHFIFLPGGQGRDGKSPTGRQTSIDKAREQLGWQPVWDFATAVQRTARWYHQRHVVNAEDLHGLSLAQLESFTADATAASAAWAK